MMIYLNKEWHILKGKLMDEQDRFSRKKNVTLALFIFIGILTFISQYANLLFSFPISNAIEALKYLGIVSPLIMIVSGCVIYLILEISPSFILVLKNLKLILVFRAYIEFGLILMIFLFTYLTIYSDIPSDEISFVFLLIFLNFVFAFFVHYLPFFRVYKVHNQKINYCNLEVEHNFIHSLFAIISPDYVIASVFKKVLNSSEFNFSCGNSCVKDIEGICECSWEQSKVRQKYFIVFSNWTNLLVALIFAGVVLLTEFQETDEIAPFLKIFLGFLILRILSRGFEIAFAFYKDVVEVKARTFWKESDMNFINYWRTSSLRRPERISLAIHSYIEVILLFSLFYFTVVNLEMSQTPCKYETFIQNPDVFMCDECENRVFINHDTKSKSYREFLLYSSSVTFFNFSFDNNKSEIWNFFHVIQVFLSIVLVVLSLAAYIGMGDKMKKKNEYDFLLTNYYRNLSKIQRQLKSSCSDEKASKLNSQKEKYEILISEIERKMKEKVFIIKGFTGAREVGKQGDR